MKMRSYTRTSKNNQEVLLNEVSIPEMQENEVLIHVEAFGVGIHDRYFIPQNISFPYVIGTEGAGVIIKKGSQVNNFNINDRVIFTTVLQQQGGAWAEYAVAKYDALTILPPELIFSEGAAIPIAGKTALESLKALKLKKNDTLFIAGASGAIGSLVMQLATLKGIRVAGSASLINHKYMQSLGIEKSVDYHDSNWVDEIKEWSGDGVSAALAIQPGTGVESIKVVKDGGRLITVSGDNLEISNERGITIEQIEHHSETHKEVDYLVEQIAKKEIKIFIEKEYDFTDALQALEKTETRHARGKVVVTMVKK